MKALSIFLLFLSFIQLKVTAQTDVPNGDFEVWTGTTLKPNFWETAFIVAGMCDQNPANERTSDAHSGNYAILTTNIICDAYEHIGAFHSYYGSSTPEYEGFPITILPENWSFYYKFLPIGADSAVASICVFQYDSAGPWNDKYDTLAFSQEYILTTQDSYAFKNLNLNYINPIDYNREFYISVDFRIKGSNQTTKLFIDDVHVSGNLGIAETTEKADFFLYPNPASEQVQLKLNEDESLRLTDLNGKELNISLQKLKENTYTFDVSKLEKGVYLVTVYSNFSQITKRFIVN